MKKWIMIIAFAAVGLSLAACKGTTKGNAEVKQKVKKGKYYCPMNPDQTSDKPGACPKCGMELVETSKLNHGERAEENWRRRNSPKQ